MAGPFKLDNQYANYAGHWLANTAYAQGKRVIAEFTNTGDARKYVFECTTAGTSADPGPPSWDVTPGNTTNDGTAVWTCREATTWANAHGKMKWIALVPAAGEILHVDDGHAEIPPSTEIWTFNGVKGNPVQIIVVDKATDNAVSDYTVSALVDFGINYDVTITGFVYLWGFHLKMGDDLAVGLNSTIVFEKSKIYSTGSASIVGVSANETVLQLNDVDIEANTTGFYFKIDSNGTGLDWRGGKLIGNVLKLILFNTTDGRASFARIVGVDISEMVGGTIVSCTSADPLLGAIHLSGLKLNANIPDLLTSSNGIQNMGEVLMDIADSGSTVYKFRREYQFGYAQDETSKVITGKALYDGTNEFTAKMVSRATPPPTSYDPWRYHLTTLRETGFAASRTYTVHIAQDHASVQPDALNDDEIWLEVVYPDDTTSQYNIKTDKIATPTTTPAAQTTSTETWEGLAATTRLQELSVQIDAADGKNGPVEIWVCLAKESKTVYVCPEVYVS